ncbi:MAG: glucosaminidase domain-containing protein [Bacteroidota bacterium]
MSSNNSTPAPRQGNNRVLTIDWSLFWQRGKARLGQLFTSLRYRAGQTEYIPPAWMRRLRLSWFRVGLMLIALFVFTQKQVDFTISVGKEGLAMGADRGRHMATKSAGATTAQQTMGVVALQGSLAGNTGAPAPAANGWSIDKLDAEAVRRYVSRFEKVAQGEEEKFSIPAPANMALAIYFSNAGQAAAAKRDNNHFGPITDGEYYENAWMNWRAHSELVDRKFPQLADESVNYQQWVAALAKTNYSSDKRLVNKLMDIIERFGLERL